MDNIIIPIGKCYKVSNYPINKNLINIVSFTENEPSMVSDELTSETEFNYWVISDSDLETNENEIYNNGNITFLRESEYTISKTFSAGYEITRRFIVEEYKFISNQLYIKNLSFSAIINSREGRQTGLDPDGDVVVNNYTRTENFKIYNNFEEYQNAIKNPTVVDYRRALACIITNEDDTYTVYFAIEKFVHIINYRTDPPFADFNYYNYKIKFLANVLKFEDKNTYSQYRKKNINSNTYTITNSYTSHQNKIIYDYQGSSYIKSANDWNATQILDGYSNGKIIVSIEMPLIKLYNNKGELIIDKKVLKVGQTFEMKYDYNANYNLYSNLLGKTFCVISCECNFNGIGKMTIKGKEM